jgi:hypothetical protein
VRGVVYQAQNHRDSRRVGEWEIMDYDGMEWVAEKRPAVEMSAYNERLTLASSHDASEIKPRRGRAGCAGGGPGGAEGSARASGDGPGSPPVCDG